MHDKDERNCNGCKHFYITWDEAFPYGCKGFKMKSKRSPSLSVALVSGAECLLFTKKRRPSKGNPNSRKT